MATVKNKLISLIKNGALLCWDCKQPVAFKNILFIDFDKKVIAYACKKCNKIDGIRRFNSVGFDCNPDEISKEDIKSSIFIILNNRIINPISRNGRVMQSFPEMLSKRLDDIFTVKIEMMDVKVDDKNLNIDDLPVCEEYKKSLRYELEILEKDMGKKGVKEFWHSFYYGAMRNKVGVMTFIRQCEREFLKGYN